MLATLTRRRRRRGGGEDELELENFNLQDEEEEEEERRRRRRKKKERKRRRAACFFKETIKGRHRSDQILELIQRQRWWEGRGRASASRTRKCHLNGTEVDQETIQCKCIAEDFHQ